MSEPLNRKNLLWEGSRFMLPEHRSALEKHHQEKQKVAKPDLDEQQLELLEQMIRAAKANDSLLTFTYWEDGLYRTIEGRVATINVQAKKIHVIDRLDDVHDIFFDMIIDVR